MSNISLIIGREFNERVRKKSFIITTLLMPLLMVGLMVAPALIMEYAQGDQKRIAVIDRSGLVAPALESDETILFETVDLDPETARTTLTDRFGILDIGAAVLDDPSDVRLYANGSTSLMLEQKIAGQIEHILEAEKLKRYDIDDLPRILAEIETSVRLQLYRNDKQEEDAQNGSSAVATAVGYVLGFLLYMFLLLYGMMVMQSVIEEKNNRVLEVMVSSARPFDLMMGKILGVASVALLQIVIWGVLIVAAATVILPQLIPADVMEGARAMQQGLAADAAAEGPDPQLLQAVATMTDTAYIAKILGCFVLFMLGGFLLYAAMFAAIGSAVDNVQDAQQFSTPVTLPIILALLMMLAVINDPDSTLSFWFSVIPFTSPIVMMARIPYDIPWWEVILSLVVLYGTFTAMVWLAAKIYRVGIFMYGKKPSFKELWRWMRYRY